MPFATGTWSIVGTVPAGLSPASPFNVAYSSAQDVLIAGVCGAGVLFSWNPGFIYRSTDRGVNWTLATSLAGGAFDDYAPVSLALLRDPVSGAERFVAAVVRMTFVLGPSPQSAQVQMWWSDDGLAWTQGTTIADAPGVGAGTTGTGITSIATRPRLVSGDPLEHYIIAEAHRNAVVSRGVYKSSDLGVTWTLVGDTAAIGSINGGNSQSALVTRPTGTLVLGNDTGLGGSAESTDGGLTWTAGSPNFAADFLLAFDPGTLIGIKRGTLTGGNETRICCTSALGWPPAQLGPSFGLSGAVVANPVIINLGFWEVLLAAATSPLGKIDVIYSNNGGETVDTLALLDTGTGIVAHLSGGAVMRDGHPVLIAGSTGVVMRSTDVATHTFGTRIYCTLAPAPGVGFLALTPACGPFYDACPQTDPADPALAEAELIEPPEAFIPGAALTWGDSGYTYGVPEPAAVWGGSSSVSTLDSAVLTRLSGCGATFVNDPCAVVQCP